MNDIRPFEEYKEMIKDMRKEEMIKGLYDLSKNVIEKENEIERLEKRNKEIYEGFIATTEELCEATKETEKLKKINKKLWEENTRLSNGRELEQNAIDTLRERIDKAIDFLKLNACIDEDVEYFCDDLRYDDCKKLLNILKGVDKE